MEKKRKQFAVFEYLSKSANEIVKLVLVCGGSGSAEYHMWMSQVGRSSEKL